MTRALLNISPRIVSLYIVIKSLDPQGVYCWKEKLICQTIDHCLVLVLMSSLLIVTYSHTHIVCMTVYVSAC